MSLGKNKTTNWSTRAAGGGPMTFYKKGSAWDEWRQAARPYAKKLWANSPVTFLLEKARLLKTHASIASPEYQSANTHERAKAKCLYELYCEIQEAAK